MANHPNRGAVAADRRAAKAAGYRIAEGSYRGTSDDRMGRWYVHHEDDDILDRRGAGSRTRGEAWGHAARLAAGGRP